MNKEDILETITEEDEKEIYDRLKTFERCCSNSNCYPSKLFFDETKKVATCIVENFGCKYPHTKLFLVYKAGRIFYREIDKISFGGFPQITDPQIEIKDNRIIVKYFARKEEKTKSIFNLSITI